MKLSRASLAEDLQVISKSIVVTRSVFLFGLMYLGRRGKEGSSVLLGVVGNHGSAQKCGERIFDNIGCPIAGRG